jgi:predicted metalloprotease with PDZ domain
VAEAVTGLRLGAFFRDAVYGTKDLPLARLLAQAGLDLKPKTGSGVVALGVRTAAAPDGVKLVNVHDGGAAQAAGLSAGDVMIAVDGLRVTHDSLQSLLARHRYESGLIDFQTVLQTQVTLLQVQDSVADAQAAVGLAHVRLYKALGGGWDTAAPAPSQARGGPAPTDSPLEARS